MAPRSAETCATTVRVRIRPSNARETRTQCISKATDQAVAFSNLDGSNSSYQYDQVYDEQASQKDVFDDVKFIVHAVLQGYNGTIMAYGQTGSGKTHTLIGNLANEEAHGIVPRAVAELGNGIAADSGNAHYDVKISIVEIYCEKIRDLLNPYGGDNLQVKHDAAQGIYIEGATEQPVTSGSQLVDAVGQGLAQRAVSATAMNEVSSRSHCIVTITVQRLSPDGLIQKGKLCMVDLAGSERQDKTLASVVTNITWTAPHSCRPGPHCLRVTT